jgi:hypothetical protein
MDGIVKAAAEAVRSYRHWVHCDNDRDVSIRDWDIAQKELHSALDVLSTALGMGTNPAMPEQPCMDLDQLDNTIRRMQDAAVMTNKPLSAIHGIEVDSAANN